MNKNMLMQTLNHEFMILLHKNSSHKNTEKNITKD
jgi:hypothetical protein